MDQYFGGKRKGELRVRPVFMNHKTNPTPSR